MTDACPYIYCGSLRETIEVSSNRVTRPESERVGIFLLDDIDVNVVASAARASHAIPISQKYRIRG